MGSTMAQVPANFTYRRALKDTNRILNRAQQWRQLQKNRNPFSRTLAAFAGQVLTKPQQQTAM